MGHYAAKTKKYAALGETLALPVRSFTGFTN
jgi:hypothetical protein